MKHGMVIALVLGVMGAAWGQAAQRLPLPVASAPGATAFECPSPPLAVLTGVLWPASGPLTSWAPVFSTLGADGTLKEVSAGRWEGPLPPRWVKVVKPGYVVAGFRVLVKTGPGTPQTRQAQIFWKAWTDGSPSGPFVDSSVHGSAAGPADTVKIIELRLPDGAIPLSLYGETLGGTVVQASLTVKAALAPPTEAPVPVPDEGGPAPPRAPTPAPLAPVGLRGISQEQR